MSNLPIHRLDFGAAKARRERDGFRQVDAGLWNGLEEWWGWELIGFEEADRVLTHE